MTDAEHRSPEDEDRENAPDPAGTYGTAPGRTGRHPEGETPGDETVPPGEPGEPPSRAV